MRMGTTKILVTGKNGQLGSELQLIATNYSSFEFIFTDVAELDITDLDRVNAFFQQHQPAICINAAAYTAVDKAESEQELALQINARAVGNLAMNCKKYGARFIHISTDYVFDGNAKSPYKEDHPVDPVNFYGESKLQGEQEAMENDPASIIIRTSWVYSFYGNNFVKTMLRLMKEREQISVINDQFGSPTYAADLAEIVLNIATNNKLNPGIYHYSNAGEISWFDFAVAIKEISKARCIVNPVDSSGYKTIARRPFYSVMDKEKITSVYNIPLKDWKESLATCISLLIS